MNIFEIMTRRVKDPPPERRSDLLDSRARVQCATELYDNNFDEDGRPTTKRGQTLSRTYGQSYWEDYPYTINGILKWFRKLKKAVKSERTKTLERQIENLTDEITKLRRKVADLEDAVYVEDDE